MMTASLHELGLVPFFFQQLSAAEHEHCHLARVISVQRSGVTVTDGVSERETRLGGPWHEVPSGVRELRKRNLVGNIGPTTVNLGNDWYRVEERHGLRGVRPFVAVS